MKTINLIIIITLLTNLNLTAQNQVLSLDGDGDYMNSNVSYSNTHKTFELWAKSNIFNDIRTILLGAHNPLANGRFYFGYETGDGYMGLGIGDNAWNNESGGYLVDTSWHHYALIWNEPDMQLYIDGNLIAEKSNTTMASDTYFIGASHIWESPWSDAHFTGVFDEVRIWNYARTQEQLQADKFTTLTGNETGLVGYWNFNDGTANDLTPNGNNGTLHGDANIIEEQIPGPANMLLNVIATSGDYFENANASVSLTLGELATETFSAGNVILTQGFQQPMSITVTGVNLDMQVYLEGPYESTEMNTNLNTAGVIPLSQPYNISPWNYPGTESVGSLPSPNVVDWILVELRETTGDASTAKPETMIAQQAAFILKDGSVVGLDGGNLLYFDNEISDNLFVVIYHRNHLPVLSAGPLMANNNNYVWDFTTSVDQAYGTNAQTQLGGASGMIGGDSDANGIINAEDKELIWATDAGNAGYFPSDMNMDSQANNPDKNDIWYPNLDKESQLPDLCGGAITDVDGNTYNTILIGTQCWMADNLKTINYRNGTPISNVTSSYWSQLTCGAYVWYDNDISFKDKYGALYNWFAIDNANGLCPTDWHVPTDDEWTTLTDFIGGISSPHSNKLKSCRQVNSPSGGYCNTTEHPRWNEDNTNHGTDDYGFSSLPGGDRLYIFGALGDYGYWWSSTENPPYHGWSRRLGFNSGIVEVYNSVKENGYSVRCIKD